LENNDLEARSPWLYRSCSLKNSTRDDFFSDLAGRLAQSLWAQGVTLDTDGFVGEFLVE